MFITMQWVTGSEQKKKNTDYHLKNENEVDESQKSQC